MIYWLTQQKFLTAMCDDDLIAAYQRTNGQPDDEEANRLLAEIERRHLDT